MNSDTAAPATPIVTIYSSPGCGFCHMAMDYLDKKEVAYTEKDISTDSEAFEFIRKQVGQAVTPVITINHTVIVGFDRPKIDDALAAYPAPAKSSEGEPVAH